MVKEVLAALLLIALLVAAVFNIGIVGKLTDDITDTVEQAVYAAESGDWDRAIENAEKAVSLWKSKDSYTHIVLRHSQIDTVSEALYDFLLEAYDQNSERLSAAAEAAMYHLDSVAQMERVRLGSVF